MQQCLCIILCPLPRFELCPIQPGLGLRRALLHSVAVLTGPVLPFEVTEGKNDPDDPKAPEADVFRINIRDIQEGELEKNIELQPSTEEITILVGLVVAGTARRVVEDHLDELERLAGGEASLLDDEREKARVIQWMRALLDARDEDGYIYIVDRKKDLVIRGGYNVYPREIEEVIYQIPQILEVAVVGVAHQDLGEELAAVVVLKEGAELDPDAIRQYVKKRVAPYKYPRIIRIVPDSLPKSGTGKILKKEIRQKFVDH